MAKKLEELNRDALTIWVIYDRPRDYPKHYVVRAQRVLQDGTVLSDSHCALADTLDDARKYVPTGRVCMQRMPDDDPVIVETWI